MCTANTSAQVQHELSAAVSTPPSLLCTLEHHSETCSKTSLKLFQCSCAEHDQPILTSVH